MRKKKDDKELLDIISRLHSIKTTFGGPLIVRNGLSIQKEKKGSTFMDIRRRIVDRIKIIDALLLQQAGEGTRQGTDVTSDTSYEEFHVLQERIREEIRQAYDDMDKMKSKAGNRKHKILLQKLHDDLEKVKELSSQDYEMRDKDSGDKDIAGNTREDSPLELNSHVSMKSIFGWHFRNSNTNTFREEGTQLVEQQDEQAHQIENLDQESKKKSETNKITGIQKKEVKIQENEEERMHDVMLKKLKSKMDSANEQISNIFAFVGSSIKPVFTEKAPVTANSVEAEQHTEIRCE